MWHLVQQSNLAMYECAPLKLPFVENQVIYIYIYIYIYEYQIYYPTFIYIYIILKMYIRMHVQFFKPYPSTCNLPIFYLHYIF